VYASMFLHGRASSLDVGSTLTIGAPSGDRSKGLGAGKVTFNATRTISRRFEFAKSWIAAGFANSVFNNAGYQRPYVTDGKAAHFAGGVDFALPRKLTFGIGGFGLEPVGNQIIYSQTVPAASPAGSQSNMQYGTGMMPGGGMAPGMGSGGGVREWDDAWGRDGPGYGQWRRDDNVTIGFNAVLRSCPSKHRGSERAARLWSLHTAVDPNSLRDLAQYGGGEKPAV